MRRLVLLGTLLVVVTAAALAAPPSESRYEAHVARLRARLPRGVFTFVIQPPFVVLGDGPPAQVRAAAAGTVGWAVRMLEQAYFAREPAEILDVYLFRDRESYQRWNRELFHETPDTPYGYYSPTHKALVMNIGTGGGTLVHEIVHPFMHANFPDCPPWFNEGLASLYEQCGERDGHIVGFTNWRLEGLQEAIRGRRTRPLKALMALDSTQFYADRGLNYAMARYLCYYLQQQGKLATYYHAFVRGHANDPTGYRTLRQVLAEPDMNIFQKGWEAWCLDLSYP